MTRACVLPSIVRLDVPGQLAKAGKITDLHPRPEKAR